MTTLPIKYNVYYTITLPTGRKIQKHWFLSAASETEALSKAKNMNEAKHRGKKCEILKAEKSEYFFI